MKQQAFKAKIISALISALLPIVLATTTFAVCAATSSGVLQEADELFKSNQYNKALSIYQKYIISEIAKEEADTASLINAYIQVGNVYTIYADYSRALNFYQKAWSMCRYISDKKQRVYCYTRIIGVYSNMNKIDSAEICNEKLRNLPNSDTGLREYFYTFNKGYIAEARGNNALMVSNMQKAIRIIDKYNLDQSMKLFSYANIYTYYEKIKEYETALRYLTAYYELAIKQNRKFMVLECYKAYMRIYLKMGNNAKALQYQEKYFSESDSVLNVTEFNRQKSEFENYEKEVEALKVREMQKISSIKTNFICIFAILLVIAISFAIVFFRQRQKLNLSYQALFDKHKQSIGAQRFVEQSYGAGSVDIAEVKEATEAKYDMAELFSRIQKVMEDEDTFCNPKFSLAMLAKLVGSNTLYVSQAINNTVGMNFRSFINEYRIKVAMKRLLDIEQYGNLSMKGIAESVGLQSQSNFIAAFKNVAGMTPNVYRKLALSDKSSTDLKIGN